MTIVVCTCAAWPSILTKLAMMLTDISFLGHLDTQYLAAGSLAAAWQLATSAPLINAWGSAVNTLASQANGAGNHKLVGTWLQISLWTICLAAVPVALAWWFTEPALLAFKFEPDMVRLAAQFTAVSLLGLPANCFYVCISSYFRAIEIVKPALVVNVCMMALNLAFNYVFVLGVGGVGGWGFVGSPLATATTRTLGAVAYWGYTCVFHGMHKHTWHGWSRDAFKGKNLREMLLKNVLPMYVGRALEEWQLQTVSFLAASLGYVAMATNSLLFNIFFFMTSGLYGFISATTIRIGFHLGANDVPKARIVVKIALFFMISGAACVAVALWLTRDYIGKVFSTDERVVELTATVMVPVASTYVALSVFYVSMAVLSGQARNSVVSVAFLLGAWGVSIPLAFVAKLVLHKGLLYLWLSMVAGYSVVTLIAAYAAYNSDWDAVAQAAVQRSLAKAKGAERLHAVAGDEATTFDSTVDESTPLVP